MTSPGMPDNSVERIRHNLVGLRMPRALEALEVVIQQLERGQLGAIEAIDIMLAEEITVRKGRRIKAALQMARLAMIKTLKGFDFSFQPSLDRNRIMALASLDFVDKHEVVHFIASPARESRTSPWRSVSRRSGPGAASISVRWPTSSNQEVRRTSTAWPRPIGKAACASASAISAAPSC